MLNRTGDGSWQGKTNRRNGRRTRSGRGRCHKRLQGFVELGEQFVQQGKLASALESYHNAVEMAPNNGSLRRRLEDVDLAFLRQRAVEAQADAKKDPADARKRAFATERLTEVTSRELAILTQRVKENPGNDRQAFRLADLYRRCNQLNWQRHSLNRFQTIRNCAPRRSSVWANAGSNRMAKLTTAGFSWKRHFA
ncbi:hypothetical protein Pcinc_023990 [Petrolisthes cinctipes]|uniref:Tetratricopeptide repeat protein n=1 Tax=Petrolisthes cinctipes TaxID=88211 RepID=A0AAE1FAQ4_PETCI|nr:hypothetical protein Pcinc_023990 [Petrolisthes cinctipes]